MFQVRNLITCFLKSAIINWQWKTHDYPTQKNCGDYTKIIKPWFWHHLTWFERIKSLEEIEGFSSQQFFFKAAVNLRPIIHRKLFDGFVIYNSIESYYNLRVKISRKERILRKDLLRNIRVLKSTRSLKEDV